MMVCLITERSETQNQLPRNVGSYNLIKVLIMKAFQDNSSSRQTA